MDASPVIVALMPMKHHSERVPAKNWRLLSGSPLYAHTLKALLGSSRVSRVHINTDTNCVALEADVLRLFPGDAHRVSVLKRPAELCGDAVPMTALLAHDVTVVQADFYLQARFFLPA